MPPASRTRKKSPSPSPSPEGEGGASRPPQAPQAMGRPVQREDQPLVETYTQSVSFDHRLAPYDIAGSIAHAKMLAKCRIISKTDGAKIVRGLEKIRREIEEGRFTWRTDLEDVHERRGPAHGDDWGRGAASSHGAEPERPGRSRPQALPPGRRPRK